MPTRLLINERPLTVLPSLVKLVGMERAVILQQVHWLIQLRHNGIIYDGDKWVWGTHEQWCEDYFSFWKAATLRKHMAGLETDGFLCSMQIGGFNRKKHYRIDYDFLEKALQEMEAAIEYDDAQSIEYDHAQSIEHDHAASMRDDHAASMRDDHAQSNIEKTSNKTSTETSKESSSSASSKPPEKSKDDDDDLIFNSVVTAWNDSMPEKATNHIRGKLKGLIDKYGPDAAVRAIVTAADAGGRSFKYVATCARNHANGVVSPGDANDAARRAEYTEYNHLLRQEPAP
jgi:hypothetical protein